MTPAELLNAHKKSIARLTRGKAAWDALEMTDSLWPPCGMSPPPAGIWEGMGEYDADAVQAVVRDAMPQIPADRAWPWVARATYAYDRERSVGAYGMSGETNADVLVQQVQKQALALRQSLHGLNFIAIRSPEEVGKQHYDKGLKVVQALQKHFAGETPKGDEYSTFTNDLKAVADICSGFQSKVAGGRKRGPSDPYLSGLVYDLSALWNLVFGRKPSAADPARKDGKPAPFVRLVNGCLNLAGGPIATPKQVAIAIQHPPTFAPVIT